MCDNTGTWFGSAQGSLIDHDATEGTVRTTQSRRVANECLTGDYVPRIKVLELPQVAKRCRGRHTAAF